MASAATFASSFGLLLPLSSSRPKSVTLIAPPLTRVAAVTKAIRRLLWSAREQRAAVVVRRVALPSEQEVAAEEVKEQAEAVTTFSEDLKLYVGNLPYSIDSAHLAGVFSEAGTVEMVEVIYNKRTGRQRGFGFVTMSTVEEVQVAAHKFNGYELEGRPLRVRTGPHPPRTGSPRFNDDANRVHVSNLSSTVDCSKLGSVFSAEGNVVHARVIYDKFSGKSRGFGYVTYSSPEEVVNAISTLNGTDLHGQAIRVVVAHPKPQRQFDA